MTDRCYELEKILKDKNLADGYFCKICMDILHAPIIECEAGHSWCYDCIYKLRDKKCPLCHQLIDIMKPIQNYALQNIIEAKECFCSVKDCKWEGTVGGIDKHWKICSQTINLISSEDEKQNSQDEYDDIEDQIEEAQVDKVHRDNNYDMEFQYENVNIPRVKKWKRKRHTSRSERGQLNIN